MDLLAGASLAIGTFLVLALIIGVVAFVVLFARRGDSGTARAGSGIAELSRRAGTLLVRLDDAVREAEGEVGYAVAQFGTERAKPFAASLDDAKGKLAEAFRTRDRDAWCALLDGTDACFSPVLEWNEAPRHPHLMARQTFVEIDGIAQPAPAPRFSRSVPDLPTPPAENDADVAAALAPWLSPARIATLRSDGTIR